jgi:hypothetical protein
LINAAGRPALDQPLSPRLQRSQPPQSKSPQSLPATPTARTAQGAAAVRLKITNPWCLNVRTRVAEHGAHEVVADGALVRQETRRFGAGVMLTNVLL